MMYIKLKDYVTSFQWHTGEVNPFRSSKETNEKYGPEVAQNLAAAEVIEIQADGEELEHIQQYFTGIPFHKAARVQRWFGDVANFIAHNL
jgi:hypothetical protein